MNFSKFFVDRPIFAGVLSTLILLIGIISIWRLPISEYPEVVPPSVVVRAQFPGANPKVIAETVASPLEEQINGVENMLYMQSQANSDGNMTTTVTFKLGTDPDKAQQLVQNRVSQALPRLPDVVQRLGVTTIKSSPDLTMVVHLLSPNDRYDMTYLRNYAVLNVKDRLARISGVGQVQLFGSGDYSMRVWLDPNKVAERGLTANEVVRAIRDQNVQVAAGVIGGSPSVPGTDLQLSVNAQGRLKTEQEFGDIILKSSPNGAVTYLRDVARIELAASEYGLRSLLDNKQAVAIPIFQAPGSNALQISDDVRKTMEELKQDFPEGVDYRIVYDPTQFVRSSIEAVTHTLLEAVALVVLVVILFLQTWRASIIPLLAVPVSIIGTFGLMLMFGFSINALSLFGLVLAIGIVVDDAIVVVENVERNIAEGLSPREATYKAMREVSGPIIAIALTLIAVFVPLAFMTGLTGQFYKQFALTIAISTVISAFNSLTLSPALAALLLKGHDAPKDWLARVMDKGLGWIFRPFNRVFGAASESYGRSTSRVIGRKAVMLGIYLALIGLTAVLFNKVPGGFVPMQDKQYLVSFAQLPDGASLDRTEDVIRRMSDIALKHPGVESAVAFPGLSINGFTNSPSAGIVFVTLKPFDQRKSADLSGGAIAGQLNKQYGAIKDAFIAVFPPPPVQGLGTVGGFKLQLEDRGSVGYEQLFAATQAFMAKARQTPELGPSFSSYQINVPQLNADLDRVKAKQLGVPVTDVFDTMQVYLGSLYVNDFNRFGRTYQVKVQADAPFRAHAEDILQLKTRNAAGDMVPLSSLLRVSQGFGPDMVVRYNGYTSADINGGPAPGFSSGQAQAAVERIAHETLPKGVRFEWTDLTYQQILAGNSAVWIFPICVLLVFLFHLRSALVAIVSLPLGVLAAFLVMRYQGVNANIMSLGGIAIAVGAMVDAAVVMIENAHKHLERWHEENPNRELEGHERWSVIGESAAEVGPALFFSLLIITLSFIPVFTLEAQEGRLFSPLAFTKTYSMAAAAGLSVTLVPVLMGYMIRGRIPTEQSNPLSRWLIRLYQPMLAKVLAYPKATVGIAAVLLIATAWPVMRIGGEFMPPLDEGDLLYMPSALPGLSAGKAAQLLQQTDRLIKTVPEVASVFGKAGRADTATDPAPIEMFETTIQFKPREQWRPGMTTDKLVEELDRVVKVPGLSNIWVPPIRNRIDMLATGIKSPVGIKVAGTDLKEIDRLTTRIEEAVKTVPGVTSALAERLSGGRYIDVDIDRMAAGRYGLNIEDVQSIVSSAVGGDNVGEVVDGLARFPINVRYPRDYRDSVEQLRSLPIVTDRGQQITLADVARIQVVQGPPMLRSENARLSGWVYVDIRGRDLRSAVKDMQAAVAKAVPMPAGYALSWSGQFEYLERASAKLKVVVPFTLLIIFVLLYLVFGRIDEALLIMGTLPLALIGGFWLLYLLGYNLSVAGVVGFIALAGVAAEFGVIMLLYLKQAWTERQEAGQNTIPALLEAIQEGAVLRVRPKAMTVAVILAGLIPIMWAHGTGSEIMQRIAAPMVGGMVTAPLLSLFVVPAVYLLIRRRQTKSSPLPTHPSHQEESP